MTLYLRTCRAVNEIERWLAESQISRLVTEYAVLTDDGAAEAVAALFTPSWWRNGSSASRPSLARIG